MERLTWNEICSRYPGKWVGLNNIEWGQDGSIVLADVVETDKNSIELTDMMVDGEIEMSVPIESNIIDVGAILCL